MGNVLGRNRRRQHQQQPSDLPAFKLERFFAKHEFCAPYLMCCSDCQPLTMVRKAKLLDMGHQTRCQVFQGCSDDWSPGMLGGVCYSCLERRQGAYNPCPKLVLLPRPTPCPHHVRPVLMTGRGAAAG